MFIVFSVGSSRGGSRISGKWVHMYIIVLFSHSILNYKRNPSVTFLGNNSKIIKK